MKTRYRDEEFKKNMEKRLRRIHGQTGGIIKMMEEDRYCVDILNQISAIRGALYQVALKLFEDHSRHCLSAALAEGGERREEALEELLLTLKTMQ